jgi:predicted Zn-dependent protease
MEMPAGWKTANTPAAAGAVAPPDGDAAVLLGVAGPGADPLAGAKADGLKDPDLKRLERLQVSGLPAARALAETRDGDRVVLTWIAYRQRVFRVIGIAPRRAWERYGAVLDRAARSFRPLRPADRERIVESRLRLRGARAGETAAQVLARGGGTWDAARVAVANSVAPDAKLDAGWPVKVAVAQRYSAGGR